MDKVIEIRYIFLHEKNIYSLFAFIRIYSYGRKLKLSTTILDKGIDQNELLNFGLSSKKINGVGINNSISQKNLYEFITSYLSRVKHLGLEEIENLLHLSESNGQTIRFKKFNIDYWIIGYHFPRSDALCDIRCKFTAFPFFFTLGIFPIWTEEKVTSVFFVFDKDLNKLTTIQLENIQGAITSWLIFILNRDPPKENTLHSIFYKPNLKQFSKELVQVLKK